jgi:hypothetical protein
MKSPEIAGSGLSRFVAAAEFTSRPYKRGATIDELLKNADELRSQALGVVAALKGKLARLVSVAKGKIARQNRHFKRLSAASFACQWEARCLSFEG